MFGFVGLDTTVESQRIKTSKKGDEGFSTYFDRRIEKLTYIIDYGFIASIHVCVGFCLCIKQSFHKCFIIDCSLILCHESKSKRKDFNGKGDKKYSTFNWSRINNNIYNTHLYPSYQDGVMMYNSFFLGTCDHNHS